MGSQIGRHVPGAAPELEDTFGTEKLDLGYEPIAPTSHPQGCRSDRPEYLIETLFILQRDLGHLQIIFFATMP